MSHKHHLSQTDTASPTQTTDEIGASRYISFGRDALRTWRRKGKGPAYFRVGRSIRYRIADLDAWLAAHRVEPRQAAR